MSSVFVASFFAQLADHVLDQGAIVLLRFDQTLDRGVCMSVRVASSNGVRAFVLAGADQSLMASASAMALRAACSWCCSCLPGLLALSRSLE